MWALSRGYRTCPFPANLGRRALSPGPRHKPMKSDPPWWRFGIDTFHHAQILPAIARSDLGFSDLHGHPLRQKMEAFQASGQTSTPSELQIREFAWVLLSRRTSIEPRIIYLRKARWESFGFHLRGKLSVTTSSVAPSFEVARKSS